MHGAGIAAGSRVCEACDAAILPTCGSHRDASAAAEATSAATASTASSYMCGTEVSTATTAAAYEMRASTATATTTTAEALRREAGYRHQHRNSNGRNKSEVSHLILL